jgi:hypothetical protein
MSGEDRRAAETQVPEAEFVLEYSWFWSIPDTGTLDDE